mgnify:CR=1 FL=1
MVRLARETSIVTKQIQPLVREMQTTVANGVKEMNQFTREQVDLLTPRIQAMNQGIRIQLEGAQTIRAESDHLSTSSTETATQVQQTFYDIDQALEKLDRVVQQLQHEVSVFG